MNAEQHQQQTADIIRRLDVLESSTDTVALADLDKRLERFCDLDGKIFDLEFVAGLNDRLVTLEAIDTNTGANIAIAALSGRLETLEAIVTGGQTAHLGSLDDRLERLDVVSVAFDKRLDGHDAHLGGLEKRLRELEERAENAPVCTADAQLEQRLDTLEEQLTGYCAGQNGLSGDVTDHEKRLDKLEKKANKK
jgi:hypothetical protein